MFVRNNYKKTLSYSAHGTILRLNPGINLIENPLFTKKELKQFFRDAISFIEEDTLKVKTETPKVETTKVEATKEVKVEEPKTSEVKVEEPKVDEKCKPCYEDGKTPNEDDCKACKDTKVEAPKVELKTPVEGKKSTKGAGKKGFGKGSKKNK